MNLEKINDVKYVLQFALDVIEEHGLEREMNDDNWILGKSIEEQIAKLNHGVSHHVSDCDKDCNFKYVGDPTTSAEYKCLTCGKLK